MAGLCRCQGSFPHHFCGRTEIHHHRRLKTLFSLEKIVIGYRLQKLNCFSSISATFLMVSDGMFCVCQQNYFPLDMLIGRYRITEGNLLCVNPADETV